MPDQIRDVTLKLGGLRTGRQACQRERYTGWRRWWTTPRHGWSPAWARSV
jgi:hypothetical protein